MKSKIIASPFHYSAIKDGFTWFEYASTFCRQYIKCDYVDEISSSDFGDDVQNSAQLDGQQKKQQLQHDFAFTGFIVRFYSHAYLK